MMNNFSYQWEDDTTISVTFRGTNFRAHFLANLRVESNSLNQKKELIYHKDSVYIAKGIFKTEHQISLPSSWLNSDDTIFPIKIKFQKVGDQEVIAASEIEIKRRKRKIPKLEVKDSLFFIKYEGEERWNLNFEVYDTSKTIEFERDTSFQKGISFNTRQLIAEKPLESRKIVLTISDERTEILKDTILYESGRFIKQKEFKSNRLDSSDALDSEEKLIQIQGEVYIENNAFSNTPQHSNSLQYPNTIFRVSNTVTIMGVPFQLNAHHTTNDNIDPNFRNFFSFSLDVNQYRNRLQKELQEQQLASEYTIPEINSELDLNQQSLTKLQGLKNTLQQYPNELIPVDSLLQYDTERLSQSELLDTIPLKNPLDTLPLTYHQVDSLSYDSNLNAKQLQKIDRLIERLQASNRYKEQLKQQKLADPNSFIPTSPSMDTKQLLQQYQGKGIAETLLRFEKLEVGNFYEVAGKYSIRDVEMKGINTSYLVTPENKLAFLIGKINNFQSFNLNNFEKDVRITSAALTNTNWSFFSPTIRYAEYKDVTINPELSLIASSNYVTSFSARGEILKTIFYESEFNWSTAQLDNSFSQQNNFSKNMALFGKVEVVPFDFLSLNVSYDQIGSNYQSDGVYFLTRNLQSYSIGSHLKLFKNKVYLKNDYTIINRNFEQEDFKNESRKLFFDIGSRFKRIPNFQLIHSPITVDIANNLDTSFSNLSAFSSVTIARIFYMKRVKKTILNTALIYSEILNDFFEGTDRQRGFQHFIGISNKKTQFSFTSSYSEVFERIRFISASIAHQFNDKYGGSIYVAKNFIQDQYSEIVRAQLNAAILKNLIFGFGGAVLLENKQAPNWGSTVSLRLMY